MAEGNASDGVYKPRTVLGELTNRLRKREFSHRGEDGIRPFNLSVKDVVKRACVWPRPCTEVNSLKGNYISSISKITSENRNPNVLGLGSDCAVSVKSIDVQADCNAGQKETNLLAGKSRGLSGERDSKILDLSGKAGPPESVNDLDIVDHALAHSCVKIGDSEGDVFLMMDKVASQSYEDPKLTDLEGKGAVISVATKPDTNVISLEHTVKGNVVDLVIDGGGEDVLNSSKLSNLSEMLTNHGRGNVLARADTEGNDNLSDGSHTDNSRTVSETGYDCASPEDTLRDINEYQDDLDDHNADNLFLSQSGSVDCAMLPESQESRVFGLERTTEPKNVDECALMNGGTDSIKACSCSFCTKAGYIWLDLNYQDIKARATAMKKSLKETSILAESYRSKAIQKQYGAENSARGSKLESDLMYQWGSLFHHMTDIWVQEGNQLEARLLSLTDLKRKCRTDLDSANTTSSGKH